ncbi:MAG TPA: HAD family hydrolase [Terriglobales bacterium]|jgi:HAD superfamily phosphatase|nr:HAD family hydrolase [Terriglobales bacterium]
MTHNPSVIIFDVDGVLVDTRGSFQRTTLETVRLLTSKRVTRSELHRWKNRPGFNDDWKLSHAWVRQIGSDLSYEEVKRRFQEIYWGKKGTGNVRREKWLLPHANLKRLASIAPLGIFTGRIYRELDYTLDRWKVRKFFQRIITVEDVSKPKPDPEGLIKILAGRDPASAIYVGDNVDDVLAANAARIPFVGVLPRRSPERRHRGTRLRELGALTILGEVKELEGWLKKHDPRR